MNGTEGLDSDQQVQGDPVLLLRNPENRVSRRAIAYWTLRAIGVCVVVLGIEYLILFVGDQPLPTAKWYIGGVTLVLALGYVLVMPSWRYAVHRWEATPTATYTQTGWFNRERRVAPTSRIQTVDSHRGPLEQMLRLANVTVTTASAAGPVKIHGLDVGTADNLVWQLTKRAEADGGDAT